ncbi:hypothetical protein [Bartonella saheliensis]|nr:hypothetical protein [Bartonella saheliensis]
MISTSIHNLYYNVATLWLQVNFLELETLWTAGMAKKAPRKEVLIRNN